MQFQHCRHSVFGRVKEQVSLPPSKPKPSAEQTRLTAELMRHAEAQMQPAWVLFAEAVPVRPVRHFARVAALVEVPEAVRLVRVRSAPLATKQVEDSRTLPIQPSTPMPTQPHVQEQHKPEQRKPTIIRAEEYASVAPIRGVSGSLTCVPMSLC